MSRLDIEWDEDKHHITTQGLVLLFSVLFFHYFPLLPPMWVSERKSKATTISKYRHKANNTTPSFFSSAIATTSDVCRFVLVGIACLALVTGDSGVGGGFGSVAVDAQHVVVAIANAPTESDAKKNADVDVNINDASTSTSTNTNIETNTAKANGVGYIAFGTSTGINPSTQPVETINDVLPILELFSRQKVRRQ